MRGLRLDSIPISYIKPHYSIDVVMFCEYEQAMNVVTYSALLCLLCSLGTYTVVRESISRGSSVDSTTLQKQWPLSCFLLKHESN